ncbi:hypothetical protein AAL_06171 [Moelleriella libera RCEF 2490]|uniref:Uncharacterized protein n=1 Tax=Moelleriella libera RCEF 2490 TaxID=1081109 RepID=A0A167ZE95_9HYPO|nr:hypothetical protein AAL_06171 [Moelleriella libera RCEF 2490]
MSSVVEKRSDKERVLAFRDAQFKGLPIFKPPATSESGFALAARGGAGAKRVISVCRVRDRPRMLAVQDVGIGLAAEERGHGIIFTVSARYVRQAEDDLMQER